MRQVLLEKTLDEDGRATLSGGAFRHLSRVLRFKAGDAIDAALPDGSVCKMAVEKIGRAELVLKKISEPEIGSGGDAGEGACEIWLLQMLPKKSRFELIVRQAAELGAAKILPVQGDYSVKGSLDMARLRKIVAEAREQSGSRTATELCEAMTLSEALDAAKSRAADFAGDAGLFALSENVAPPLDVAATKFCRFSCAAVGCEGGFSPGEFASLLDAGFSPVHFETNVLRVETAALYGLAALQTEMARLRRGKLP